MDELYANILYDKTTTIMGISTDQKIAVFKNGQTTILPEPINLPGSLDFHPFLTDDCRTEYVSISSLQIRDIGRV